jgi:hypothetical protein
MIAVFALLAAVVLTAVAFNLLFFPAFAESYEIHINRNTESPDEAKALAAAESINYSDITKQERFDGSTDPEDYLHPKTYLAYTSANYIDAETLMYYQVRYNDLQGNGKPGVIKYTYDANVSEYRSLRIYNSPAPEGVAWHNGTIVLAGSTINGSVVSKIDAREFYIRNQTGYTLGAGWDYDYNFTDCIVVRMTLEYDEIYAPTAAFFATVNQVVILDRDYKPLLIGVSAGTAVA